MLGQPLPTKLQAGHGLTEGREADAFQVELAPPQLVRHGLPVGDHRVHAQPIGRGARTQTTQFGQGGAQRSTHQRVEVPQGLVTVEEHGLDHPMHVARPVGHRLPTRLSCACLVLSPGSAGVVPLTTLADRPSDGCDRTDGGDLQQAVLPSVHGTGGTGEGAAGAFWHVPGEVLQRTKSDGLLGQLVASAGGGSADGPHGFVRLEPQQFDQVVAHHVAGSQPIGLQTRRRSLSSKSLPYMRT